MVYADRRPSSTQSRRDYRHLEQISQLTQALRAVPAIVDTERPAVAESTLVTEIRTLRRCRAQNGLGAHVGEKLRDYGV